MGVLQRRRVRGFYSPRCGARRPRGRARPRPRPQGASRCCGWRRRRGPRAGGKAPLGGRPAGPGLRRSPHTGWAAWPSWTVALGCPGYWILVRYPWGVWSTQCWSRAVGLAVTVTVCIWRGSLSTPANAAPIQTHNTPPLADTIL